MSNQPITYLILCTTSSDTDYNGDCDYCLVRMTAQYVAYLLGLMDEVSRLCQADKNVYALECWDACPAYVRCNGKLQELSDIHGDLAVDVLAGDPILLHAGPQFKEKDFQRVDCQTVQVTPEEAWWTAYVKHANTRIESAHVRTETLVQILESFGAAPLPRRPGHGKPVDARIQRIHDLLYLDTDGDREFYRAEKEWTADMIDMIAEVVAEVIPRPKET